MRAYGSTSPRRSQKMRRCAVPLLYNHHIPFPDARASLYERRRRSTVYGRRNPVREIGSTRSPARKTAFPQLTRATARRRRANPTKKRTNGQVAATACIGGGGSSRSNGANRRSHTDALPLDLDTDLLPTHRPGIRCLSRFRSPRHSAGSVNCARRRSRWGHQNRDDT